MAKPIHNVAFTLKPVRATVLHLASSLDVGADAREVVDLAVQAHRAGWKPIVASAGGALVLEAERAAVRHTRVPLNRHNFFSHWRVRVLLEALVQRERPALIHAHGFDTLKAACALACSRRLPLLVDLTEPVEPTKALRRVFQALMEQQAWFRVPSDFMAACLQREFGLNVDRFYRVPPGVDLHWYDAARVSPERLQKLSQLWRIPEQTSVVLMFMPLASGYGHRALLEAVAAMKRDDVFVIMVGDDRQSPGSREEIESMVVASGLAGKAIMPAECPDLAAACWLSTVVVAPNTQPRGQAMELLAAQALGRPVIVTDCGANAEMALAGETAWVVPPDDPAAFRNALEEAVQMNEAQRTDLAIRTREYVAANFPQTAWCEGIVSMYEGMVGR